MPNIALSEVRVKALRPRPSAYDIRHAKLRGFGVRVLTSGAKRFFIRIQHRGTRVWKIVGDTSAMYVDEARGRATSLLAAIRSNADAPASPDATRFSMRGDREVQFDLDVHGANLSRRAGGSDGAAGGGASRLPASS